MNVTVAEFKAQFPRFSPSYLPIYIAGTYFKGDVVYYNNLFYQVVVASTSALPTVATDWILIDDTVLNYTQDDDITNAMTEAQVNFNEGLFVDEATKKLVFLYLTAHYLTNDMNTAIGNNNLGIVASKSVGSVSVSYTLPKWLTDSNSLSMYATTPYGVKYATLIKPLLAGNVFIVNGNTT